MDMLCFIYINSRSIQARIKQTDQEEALLRELIANLLLNQENNLVKGDIASEGNNEAD